VIYISDLSQKILDLKRSFADLMSDIENLVKTYDINVSELGIPLAPQEKPNEPINEIQDFSCDYGSIRDEDIDMMLKNLEAFYK